MNRDSILHRLPESQMETVRQLCSGPSSLTLISKNLFQVFGELAILYNCKRTASVRAVVEGRVWALERRVFQHIMVTSGIQRIENQVSSSRSCSINRQKLEKLPH